jgi:hypothetical protein
MPERNNNDNSDTTRADIREMSPSERVRWMQAKAVMANAGALRKQVPELPPYLALTHTVNKMITQGALTPEEYLRWTAGLMKAARRPMFYSN